jgi:hypothetical protein
MKQRDETGDKLAHESPRARVAHFIRIATQRGFFSQVWQWIYWCGAIAGLAMLLIFVLSPLLGVLVSAGLLVIAVVRLKSVERRWREEDRLNPDPKIARDWMGRSLEPRSRK